MAPPLHLKVFRIPGLLGLLLLASAQLTTLGAQQSPCDPSLLQSTQDRNGYRQRGDRCEGVYIQAVASPALRVISFTESFESFDPASGTSLQVEWDSPPARGPVHLRGNALRPHLYYRFDTIRPPDSTGYSWPPTVLQGLDLRKPELGVVAWVMESVGGTTRDVYLPIRIGQRAAPASAEQYQLVLVPGTELAEVFMSLAPVEPGGQPGKFIQQDRPLKRGFYPAGRGLTIPIAGFTTSGVYYLELSATLRAGGSSTARLWFYHPGE